MAVVVHSAQVVGLEAQPILVEVDITPGLHLFSIVGLADKEIQESRERISAAIKNIGALAPHKKSQRVIVNLAPADLKKGGPAFDLPIALGYLLASRQLAANLDGTLFLGELGLDGSLRRVGGVLPAALCGLEHRFSRIIVPQGNGREAALAQGIEVIESSHLSEIIEYLSGRISLQALVPGRLPEATAAAWIDFKDIHGQESAKRALTIAAAGGHNLLMFGPPGAGKTILAQSLPGIFPPLSEPETLELTKIYSVAGLLDHFRPFINERPFRNPHHTSSHTAVIGGGAHPRPGEVTLAHRGVLFLDEFPEFDRRVIEALRQPLESRSITVARTQGVHTFPADFTLVAAMNPCPCGNFGNPRKDCTCAPAAVHRYRKKISGPILDRIDIHLEVPAVSYEKIEAPSTESSEKIRNRVIVAREIQRERLAETNIETNAQMGVRELKRFVAVKNSLKPLLKLAYERYRLSVRSYHRILKLARTIADVEESEEIEENHLTESLQYRPKVEL